MCPKASRYFAATPISAKLHFLGQVMENKIALLLQHSSFSSEYAHQETR
jgi:hypothetical protein